MPKLHLLFPQYWLSKEKLQQTQLNRKESLFKAIPIGESPELSLSSIPLKQGMREFLRVGVGGLLATCFLLNGFAQRKSKLSPIFMTGGSFMTGDILKQDARKLGSHTFHRD